MESIGTVEVNVVNEKVLEASISIAKAEDMAFFTGSAPFTVRDVNWKPKPISLYRRVINRLMVATEGRRKAIAEWLSPEIHEDCYYD